MTNLNHLARKQLEKANNQYHRYYDNLLFVRAINGKTNLYANQLINEALAICGHPGYKISNRNWSVKATDFLSKFNQW